MTPTSGQDRHAEVRELIPWWINGRLSPDEAATVAAHLESCGVCREDAAAEERLRSAMRQSPRVEYAPQASLQKLLGRIDGTEPGAEPPRQAVEPPASTSAPQVRTTRWRLAAALTAAVGLGLLASALLDRPPAVYRTTTTAGSPATSAVQLRVVFAPAMTIEDLTRVVRESGLSIVAGPSASGVYGLALEPGSRASASEIAARLREDPRVRFAEPVSDAPLPSR